MQPQCSYNCHGFQVLVVLCIAPVMINDSLDFLIQLLLEAIHKGHLDHPLNLSSNSHSSFKQVPNPHPTPLPLHPSLLAPLTSLLQLEVKGHLAPVRLVLVMLSHLLHFSLGRRLLLVQVLAQDKASSSTCKLLLVLTLLLRTQTLMCLTSLEPTCQGTWQVRILSTSVSSGRLLGGKGD